MSRKIYLSLVLWVLAAFVPAMAQNTLTIYDGENFNAYVPIDGYNCDAFQKCEIVIPAAELADMNGCPITEITWYLETKPTKSWGNFQIYMMEVEDATISSFYGMDDATVVYDGALDASGDNFVIELSTPYVYNGGNLLIGISHPKGAYSRSNFYGTTVEGASIQNYSYTSLDAVSATQRNFIPKTTFAYSPAGTPVYAKPKNLAASNIGPNEATLTWEAGSTETAWNVEYKKTTDTEWTQAGVATSTTFVLDALANGYEYEARVQGDYGDGLSNWVSTTFSTPLCAPEDQGVINYTLGDHYSDGWNGASIQVVSAATGYVMETITLGTGSSSLIGTLPLCYGETYNFVWVHGSYDNECSFTFTDPDGNVILQHGENEEFTDYNLLTYTMSMSQETGIEEFYVVGTFNEWNPTEEGGRVPLVGNEEGTEYTGVVDLLAGSEFKIITPNPAPTSEEDQWIWFGGADENEVGYFLINNDMLNIGISLIDGANFHVELGGEYTITVKEAEGRGVQEPLVMEVSMTPTAITTIANDMRTDNAWYNLQGVKLNGVPAVPGIYIHNGKKVVIK